MPFEVPIIDLGAWADGDETARWGVAAALDVACREVGFMQIVGHSITDDVLGGMLAAADDFFGLPVEAKLATKNPDLAANRGYSGFGSEALAYSLGEVAPPPDLFEAFNIGEDAVPDDSWHAAERHRFFAPNVWPVELPQMRAQLVAYFAQARRVAVTLTDVFAVALGLPEQWFRPYIDHSTTTLRLNHYLRHAAEADPLPGQQRMGAHTDYGVVTVLYADPDVAGLQIMSAAGEWVDVLPQPGALLVNLGDLSAEWTNDRWRSTLHRVVPPATPGPARRRSAAFFFDANYDAVIECLPTCCSTANPPRYPAVIAGEHVIAKIMGPRQRRSTTAALNTLGDRVAQG